MDYLDIVLVFNFFIEVSKFTVFNFDHWRVIIFNPIYFSTLGKLKQDLGRCSLCFFIDVDVEVILLNISL